MSLNNIDVSSPLDWSSPVADWRAEAAEKPFGMPVPSGVPAPDLEPADVEHALASANVPTLLATLVQLTGSWHWLEDRYRPVRNRGLVEDDGGGLPENVQAEVRQAAAVAVQKWLNGEPAAIVSFTPEQALHILSFTVGEDVPAEYADYIKSEVALSARAGGAGTPTSDALAGLEVSIIGAGVSGIAAAIALTAQGADVVLFERSDDLGGTWHLNRYPGCGVDTASHLYQLSYEPGDWAFYYSPQAHIKEYFKQVADRHDVSDRVRLGAEVTSAQFDGSASRWRLSVRYRDGAVREHSSDVLISAVGTFGTASIPAIDGLDHFRGPTYHTAEWSADADLSGKRVAVVGTGASAMQFVPTVADDVASMTIFQRSPQWAAPFNEYHKPIEADLRSLLRSVPVYRAWYKARLGWMLNDKVHRSLQIDPEWNDEGRSINAINAGHRRFFTRYMESELDGDADLLAKTLPSYPPFGKRMLLDNGWFRTLRRDNVDLVVDPIDKVEADGIRTKSGALVEVDALVLATGFDVVHYLASVDVRGVDGTSIKEVWNSDDGRAYLGLTVPGFPNLFCLYGPNAAPGHGGSYITAAECQLNYLVDLLCKMRRSGADSLDVKPEVYERYNARVDDAHNKMIWTHPGFGTYYRNSRGRVVYANPFRIVDFWHMTRSADLTEYSLDDKA
jgi:4-hydroxyacetophenone monooxygenase